MGQVERQWTVFARKVSGDGQQSAHVIRMFVGHDDASRLLGVFAGRRQSRENFLAAQSRIHEDSRASGADKRTVAGTRTCENPNLDDSPSSS